MYADAPPIRLTHRKKTEKPAQVALGGFHRNRGSVSRRPYSPDSLKEGCKYPWLTGLALSTRLRVAVIRTRSFLVTGASRKAYPPQVLTFPKSWTLPAVHPTRLSDLAACCWWSQIVVEGVSRGDRKDNRLGPKA
jgi:hypothetical protein